MIVFPANGAQVADVSVVGGKGAGLLQLVGYGFRVPDFFVIAAGTDTESDAFIKELEENAEKLHCDRFCVRSSGVSEDGASASFAGQYRTETNVRKDGLLAAVRSVFESAGAAGAAAYARNKERGERGIAVIVQRKIEGRAAGVLFSTAPQNADAVLVERVRGAGENLVSGKTVPETLFYAKDAEEDGYEGELLRAARLLEEREGCPVDVEWAYDGTLWFLQLRRQTALSDKIPAIPPREWDLYVYRDFTVFNHSVQQNAAQEQIQHELFGFSVPVAEGIWVCGREFYSPQNDAAANEIWASADKGDFFDDFSRAIERNVRATKRRCAAVRKRDYAAMSDHMLFASYAREINYYTQSYVPMMMRPDEYLYRRLAACAGDTRARELTEAVRALLPPTLYSRERTCFLQAAACGKSEKYLSRYEWQNNPLGKIFQPLTEREFAMRAAHVTRAQAERLLRESKAQKRAERNRARKVLASAEGEEARLARLILRFTYYRTRTAENSDRYFYYIRKHLLSEICRRAGISDQTLLLYRADEVMRLREGKRLADVELTKRKNGEAVLLFGNDIKTYFGANAYALLRTLLPETHANGEVRGEIACAGEAVGTVKVVADFAQAERMEEGCIVVASMTTPDIVFALEKAIGIITDEGGITCHAAIVAREYAVPCLVGTKVATAVLRDGMRVKLDCVNGKFEILE